MKCTPKVRQTLEGHFLCEKKYKEFINLITRLQICQKILQWQEACQGLVHDFPFPKNL